MPSTADYLSAQVDPLKVQREGSDYVSGLYDQAAKLKAGNSFAAGNYTGAATDLAGRGDIAGAEQVKNYGNSQFQQQHEYIQRAIPVFQHIFKTASANGDKQAGAKAVASAFDTIAPDLKTLGVPDDKLQQYREALSTNPEGTLEALNAVAARKFSYQKIGDNGVGVFDDNTGQMIGLHQGQHFQALGPGQKLVQTGDDGNAAAPTGPQPAAAPMQAAAQPGTPATPPAGDALFGQDQAKPQAVSMVESSGNPNAVSPKGAIGTMQTMPATLANPGFGVTPTKDNSPEEQTRVGNDYLGALQQRYGNPTLGLIAYNMGPGATDAWIKAGANFKDLPQETKDYLGHVAVTQATGQGDPPIGAPNLGPAAPAAAAAGGGAKVVYDGGPVYRKPTDEELKQYPGAVQINSATGQVKYPPLSAAGAAMTDDQLQPLVEIVKAGGTLPSRAQSNPAVFAHILQLAQQQGVSPTAFLANQGNRKATQATFQNVNTRYALVQTQEQAFQNSLNLAFEKVKALGINGGGTFINSWRNYLKTGVSGDPATGAAINAVSTAMNEYGKIIEGSTGNAGSSISARDDANKMLSGADNIPAFVEKMGILQQDAGYKIGALKDQHDTLLATLNGIGQAPVAEKPSKVIDFNSLPKH